MSLIKKNKIFKFIIALAFILVFVLIGVSLRLLPHPPNFAPIAAIALFGGVYLSRKVALILPFAVLVISDIFLGGYYHFPLMVSVYGSFLIIVFLGFLLKKYKKWYTIGGSAVLSAVLFFIVTNFAVWAFSRLYPLTFTGLMQSYLMAIPFFKNTLLGNLFYTTVFFGVYELAGVWIRARFKIPAKMFKSV